MISGYDSNRLWISDLFKSFMEITWRRFGLPSECSRPPVVTGDPGEQGKGPDVEPRETWALKVYVPHLTWGPAETLTFTKPQFPSLWNGNNNISQLKVLLWDLKEIMWSACHPVLLMLLFLLFCCCSYPCDSQSPGQDGPGSYLSDSLMSLPDRGRLI